MVNATATTLKNIAAIGKICHLLFHYGVFDLPLPCRFHVPTVANLETDLALPATVQAEPNNKRYEELEFLNKNTSYGTRMQLTLEQRLLMELRNESFDSLSSNNTTDVAFSNLYPAVIECFAIILCGYGAGRGNLISQTESKGLNVFVGTFSLPSLIFISMAKLDFSSVNWIFLSSICLSKTLVFFVVAIVTLLVYRPIDFSRAGLFAIFCTQSNDFALGYPIIAALYSKTHPEFAAYLYLVAPISLVFLNPIGFVMMEIGKRKLQKDDQVASEKESCCFLVLNIVKEFVLNPFVFMTALGIAANFIFNQNLPIILEGILKVLGQAFSASALFLLGLSMVGKVETLRGSGLVAPGILIAVKTLVLPLVTREVIGLLKPGISANETTDFSNYGFLYGTFPTAPGVFVFASKYQVAVDMIASSMVACTFLSAPLMFISAKMVTLVSINPFDYVLELEAFLYNVSIVGCVCSVWIIIIFLLSKKWNKVPHYITLCLAISQCFACIGAILWSVMDCNHSWKLYIQFFLFSFGVFSSRIWTALLAVTLFLLRWRSLSFVLRLRPYLALIGWGVPAVIVASLVLVVQQETDLADRHDPNFQYGSTQAIVALLILWFSLFTTMVCLILHQRFEKRYAHYESLLNHTNDPDNGSNFESPDETPILSRSLSAGFNGNYVYSGSSESLEDLGSDASSHNESLERESLFSHNDSASTSTHFPHNNVTQSNGDVNQNLGRFKRNQLTEPEESTLTRDRDDEFQIMRHIVLLLLLCGSMTVGFSLCMWTLISQEINGIYIELVFLDVVLNFGQGVFTAVIFGLDPKLIIAPFLKSYRRLLYGAPTINLPPLDKLTLHTKQTCEQFTNYHMEKCIKDIVRNRSWRLKQLPSVFAGKELVDWLLLVGLAHDRTDAVKYGRRLLMGRIVRHTENLHHFHDQALFYTFVTCDEGAKTNFSALPVDAESVP